MNRKEKIKKMFDAQSSARKYKRELIKDGECKHEVVVYKKFLSDDFMPTLIKLPVCQICGQKL